MIALPALGSVGVMLNHGDGTFAAVRPFNVGLPQYLGAGTLDFLALVRRQDGSTPSTWRGDPRRATPSRGSAAAPAA